MNYAVHGTVPHAGPRRGAFLQRSAGIARLPGAGAASLPTRAWPHLLNRVRAAWSGRRRGAPADLARRRTPTGSGVSPMAGGASRGAALLGGW